MQEVWLRFRLRLPQNVLWHVGDSHVCDPPRKATLCTFASKECCITLSVQLIWKWRRRFYIAWTLKPCALILHGKGTIGYMRRQVPWQNFWTCSAWPEVHRTQVYIVYTGKRASFPESFWFVDWKYSTPVKRCLFQHNFFLISDENILLCLSSAEISRCNMQHSWLLSLVFRLPNMDTLGWCRAQSTDLKLF